MKYSWPSTTPRNNHDRRTSDDPRSCDPGRAGRRAGAGRGGDALPVQRSGDTTYNTCEGKSGKTECRSFRMGRTTYTRCR